MPEEFDRCVANGGKVRTKDLGKGKYMHVCIPKGGGSSVGGEVKTKKDKGKRLSNALRS
jgi:hypothetical protein